jgi:hypothetical protein
MTTTRQREFKIEQNICPLPHCLLRGVSYVRSNFEIDTSCAMEDTSEKIRNLLCKERNLYLKKSGFYKFIFEDVDSFVEQSQGNTSTGEQVYVWPRMKRQGTMSSGTTRWVKVWEILSLSTYSGLCSRTTKKATTTKAVYSPLTGRYWLASCDM